MRHQKHGRKFGRQSGPRHALFSNMVSSLIEHERIKTTDAKAKELRRIAERAISWATSVGSLVNEEKKDAADKAKIVHAMRMAQRVVKHKPSLHKLFNELGPRLLGRAGGYTRVLKLGYRHGDAAPLSIIELVDRVAAEPEETTAAEPEGKGKKKAAKAEAATAEAPAKKAKAPKKAAASESASPSGEEKPAKKAKATKKKTEE